MMSSHGSLKILFFESRTVVDIFKLVSLRKPVTNESSKFSSLKLSQISCWVFSVYVKSIFTMCGQACMILATWRIVQTWVPLMDSSSRFGIWTIVLMRRSAGSQYKLFRLHALMVSREMYSSMNLLHELGVKKEDLWFTTRPLLCLWIKRVIHEHTYTNDHIK